MADQVDALIGVAKARGLLSREFQRLVRIHCEKGNVEAIEQVVASVLLSQGIAKGEIPPNAGVPTPELKEKVVTALWRSARTYYHWGGVLTAKDYSNSHQLVGRMLEMWKSSFAPQVPVSGKVLDDELNQRSSLAAQALLEVLREFSGLEPEQMQAAVNDPHEFSMPIGVRPWKLEDFCKKGVAAVIRAFNEPNAAIHEKLHGEEP